MVEEIERLKAGANRETWRAIAAKREALVELIEARRAARGASLGLDHWGEPVMLAEEHRALLATLFRGPKPPPGVHDLSGPFGYPPRCHKCGETNRRADCPQ